MCSVIMTAHWSVSEPSSSSGSAWIGASPSIKATSSSRMTWEMCVFTMLWLYNRCAGASTHGHVSRSVCPRSPRWPSERTGLSEQRAWSPPSVAPARTLACLCSRVFSGSFQERTTVRLRQVPQRAKSNLRILTRAKSQGCTTSAP